MLSRRVSVRSSAARRRPVVRVAVVAVGALAVVAAVAADGPGESDESGVSGGVVIAVKSGLRIGGRLPLAGRNGG
jgi:hypothetical protein